MKQPSPTPPFCRIGLFRALLLGDLLCISPVLRTLRSAYPQAQITLIGLPWARALLRHYPEELDAFIEFPGYPGLKERDPDLDAFPEFIRQMHDEPFDLLIQLHGNGTITNPLVGLFGARKTAGYYLPGGYCPSPETYLAYPENASEVWRHLRLMEHLGLSPDSDRLSFFIPPEDEAHLEALLEEQRIAAPYVCLHPGTRAAWRCWPEEAYAALADALCERGYTVVFTGSAPERELASAIIARMSGVAINLAGRTANLGVLAALLKGAGALVCGDTGVSHLASAIGASSVVIFMRSEREGWPPSERRLHRVVSNIRGVTVGQVLAQVEELTGMVTPAAHNPSRNA